MPTILARKVAGYEPDRIRAAVSAMLDASGLAWRGSRVLVKPNLLGPFTPQSAVVTHPVVIGAVREELLRRGSSVQVGDNPGIRGYGNMAKTARISGAGDAAGEDFVNLTMRPRIYNPASRFVDSVSVSSEVLEADLVVSLPKFKTHMSTVITGAVKNCYGYLVGADKARLHTVAPRPGDFGELLVDIYSIRPPDLVIMDAVTGMGGNGPSGGDVLEVGYLLSSDDGGAMDLAMCHMMGIDPTRVSSQRVATSRGLAPRNLDQVDIEGELPVIPHFKAPSNFVRFDPWGLGQRLIFGRISRPRMKVDRELCTACGSCLKGCPADAIILDDYPVFDYRKCIACYCCYELCPERALKTGRAFPFMRRR